MNFFDYIKNEAFFKPLTLKYKKIYQVMLTSKKRGAMNCSHREYFLYFANVAGYFQERWSAEKMERT